jgi:hypothetical protein
VIALDDEWFAGACFQPFVVMHYFGSLRRPPDVLYLEWLVHLDATSDYRSMINGFVNSIEYRRSFAP